MNLKRSSRLKRQLFFIKNTLRKRLSLNNKRSDHFYSNKVREDWHGY